MATQGNYKECEGGKIKGTDVLSCRISTGIPDGVIAVPKTWEFDPKTEDFNDEYISNQIQARNFHPFLRALDFSEENEGTTFKTYNTSIKVPTKRSPPELKYTFSNDYAWHAAVSSFNGFGNYDFIKVWKNNIIGVVVQPDGKWKALDGGYFDVQTYKNNNGTDPSETIIGIQVINEEEYNQKMSLLDGASAGFSIASIRGVLDVVLEVPTLPLTGATTTSVKVTAEANPAINITGLPANVFKITGKTVSGAVFNTSTKMWDLTHDAYASGDAFTVSLNDGTYPSAKAVNGVIYSGESESYTVA